MRYFPEHLQAEFDSCKDCAWPSEKLKAEFMSASDEDSANWLSWVAGLPLLNGLKGDGLDSNGHAMHYGTGDHSVKSLRAALAVARPKRIFEIGFNVGYGAVSILNLAPQAYLLSVDVSNRKETTMAASIVKEKFGDRFDYRETSSRKMIDERFGQTFDTIFIDGSHLEPDIDSDIEFGRMVGARFFIFDDWWPCFGDVQKSIAKSGIEIAFLHGNIALGVA